MADWFSAGVLLARQQRFRSGENAIFPIFSKWPSAFWRTPGRASPRVRGLTGRASRSPVQSSCGSKASHAQSGVRRHSEQLQSLAVIDLHQPMGQSVHAAPVLSPVLHPCAPELLKSRQHLRREIAEQRLRDLYRTGWAATAPVWGSDAEP